MDIRWIYHRYGRSDPQCRAHNSQQNFYIGQRVIDGVNSLFIYPVIAIPGAVDYCVTSYSQSVESLLKNSSLERGEKKGNKGHNSWHHVPSTRDRTGQPKTHEKQVAKILLLLLLSLFF